MGSGGGGVLAGNMSGVWGRDEWWGWGVLWVGDRSGGYGQGFCSGMG